MKDDLRYMSTTILHRYMYITCLMDVRVLLFMVYCTLPSMPVHIDLLYRVGINRADTHEDATRVLLCVPGFCNVSHMTVQMYPRQTAIRSIYSVSIQYSTVHDVHTVNI